ncbi:diflavin flavoprotein [Waterburya agarophytonicola K14]|uniref:Diflavin flavoprotein n=1 Tax=Waterburya agarophytonicola KI4 TaxID=2874699 RepID=A0A964BQJ7_9CYAN|nr:diflavin flavoprotein [Waterburya agarophytonicola]MCC0176991.1 diflavin flavoprotein [Waterburya agarophytonicola KI4]
MSPVNKAKDVQVFPVAANTRVLRSRTWDRLKFEIEYALQKGTTANSYLIEGDKTALFDPPGESFTDIFLDALKERIDPQTIDYVILGHINPNRAKTLQALLEIAPNITIVCTNPGAISLRKILAETELNIQVIKGEETLDLGQGHVLEFTPTANPRYPDHLCTYDRKTAVLYTDKLFGCHVCGDRVFDEGWTIDLEDRRYYFDCLMAPHARQIINSLDKIKDKPARIYGTGHGSLVRYSLIELTADYRNWAKQQSDRDLSVALIYASAYGNTATIAQAIARGITKAGVAVESINAESAKPEEIESAIKKSAGFIMGSPTLGGHAPTQIQAALGIVLANAAKTQLSGVFGSFGWSGEAVDLLENKFRNAGYKMGFEPIRVKFTPTDAVLKTCEEAGTDFAQELKKAKRKSKKVRQAQGITSNVDRTAQAVGRLVGSMCIVTTKKEEVSGAMLASWVSQATFSPPGLTVAVAKERAIESLLYKGNSFVLNVLPEGNHLGMMKHFLKPFAPGEDRFEGISTEEAENGCPILTDSLAYVECQVANRMECGDHWLLYAVAQQGKVFESDAVTAIHHRKSGTHY